jgi:hypothetical protein
MCEPGKLIQYSDWTVGWTTEESGFYSRHGQESFRFCSLQRPDWLWGPPNLLSNGYQETLSQEVNWLLCVTHHSHPPLAGFRYAWSYISIPTFVFLAWCLIKHRANCKGPCMPIFMLLCGLLLGVLILRQNFEGFCARAPPGSCEKRATRKSVCKFVF